MKGGGAHPSWPAKRVLGATHLLQLLLEPELVRVAADLLAAVRGTRRQASVADAAHLLVAVVLLRELDERGLNHTTDHARQHVDRRARSHTGIRERRLEIKLLALEDQADRIARHASLQAERRAHIGTGRARRDVDRECRAVKAPRQKLHVFRRDGDQEGRRPRGLGELVNPCRVQLVEVKSSQVKST